MGVKADTFTWRSAVGAGRREVVTPDGVPLHFTVASAGDRIVAFAADAGLILLAVVALVLLIGLSAVLTGEWALALGFLALFLLRNFYFTYFELRWKGSTPGKRLMGIRVMDAHGGILRSEAILVRNLTREVEVFLPALAVFYPESVGVTPGWIYLVSIPWLLVFALLPLFNRDRLRIGDLVAGTMVVKSPRTVLLPPLTARASASSAGHPTFTDRQLDVYGVYELQVLEELLRHPNPDRRSLQTVAAKIRAKIAWTGPADNPREFLRAFYEAQRARLEQKLLLGKARGRKREGRLKRRKN